MQARFLAGSVSAIALMTSMTAANAADLDLLYGPTLDFDTDSYAQAVADVASASLSRNAAEIRAAIQDNAVLVEINDAASQTAAVVAANIHDATAIGNLNDTLVETTGTGGDGLGILTVMVNEPASSANSEITGSDIGITEESVIASSETVSNNTVRAITRLNDAVVDVDEEITADMVTNSSLSATTLFNTDPTNTTDPTIESDATIAVATSQFNTDLGGTGATDIRGSASQVRDTAVGIEVITNTTAGPNTSGAFSVEGNSVSAAFTGNRASNSVDASSETDFTGSVALTGQQLNGYIVDIDEAEDQLDDAVASVYNTIVAAQFGVNGAEVSVLDGAVHVAGNSVDASATGNDITNALSFDAGVDLTGASGSVANSTMDLFGEPSSTTGDLTVVNQQANAPFTARAVTSNTAIGVAYEEIDASGIVVGAYYDGDGEVVQGGNEVTSSAAGNIASNSIDASANAINAGVALVNAQVVGRRATGATTPGEAGSADTIALTQDTAVGVDTTGYGGTTFIASAVDVDGNVVSSRADGSSATNEVSLDAGTSLQVSDDDIDLTTLVNLTSDANATSLKNDGGAILSNFQGSSNSTTSASTENTAIGLDGEYASYEDSAVSVDLNDVAATAIGHNVFNQMSLAGNSVDGSAGLNNVQVHGGQDNDEPGGIAASVSGALIGANATSVASIIDAAVSVDGNDVTAISRANVATNELEIASGEGATLDADGGSVAVDLDTNDTGPTGNAQYFPSTVAAAGAILANTQITNQDSTADVVNVDVGSQMSVDDGNVTGSGISVDGNAVMADAIGNLVVANSPGNHLMVDAGTTLAVDDTGNPDTGTVLALSNLQDRAARGDDPLGSVVTADVEDVTIGGSVFTALDQSDLSVINNSVTGRAFGNYASENQITVTGNEIVLAGNTSSTMVIDALDGGEIPASQAMSPMQIEIDSDAAIVLANVQRGSLAGISSNVATDGSRDTDDDTRVIAYVQGDITDSSVAVDANALSSIAYENTATNGIALGDDNATLIATNTSLMSQQIAAGPVSAVLGVAGEPGTPEDPGTTVTVDGEVLSVDTTLVNPNATIIGGTYFIPANSVTANQITALLGSGWSALTQTQYNSLTSTEQNLINVGDFIRNVSASTIVSDFGLSGTTVPIADVPGTGDDILNVASINVGATAATDPTLAIPNITAEMDGNITDSTISVSDNATAALARANAVTNLQSVEATTVTGNSGITTITVEPGTDTDDSVVTVNADYATQNLQTRDLGASVDAEAYVSVGIASDIDDTPDIVRSSLAVDGNSHEATAEGNVANNTLSVAGTTLGVADTSRVTSDISSVQTGLAGGSSIAEMDVFAPVAVSESSVSMSGNTNLAETALNTATNSITQTATNIYGPGAGIAYVTVDPAGDPTFFDIGTLTVSSAASLSNIQAGSGADDATAEALLAIHNTDDLSVIDNTYDALVASGVTVEGNRVDALVSGNTATNSVTQSGDSSVNVSAGLSNLQISENLIDADSTLDIGLSLTQNTAATAIGIENSSVAVTENVNVARGTGNIARNSVAVSGTDINGPVGSDSAGFALLGTLDTPVGPVIVADEVAAVGSAVAVNQQYSLEDVTAEARTTLSFSDTSNRVSDSSIVQDNNLTLAEATGNLSGRAADASAVTTIDIDGTTVAGAATALSYQEGEDAVEAVAVTNLGTLLTNSGLANGNGLVRSMVSLSGNQTGAYATMNDATTIVSVSGSTIEGSEITNFGGLGDGSAQVNSNPIEFVGGAVVGDNVLMSSQVADGSVDSSATLNALSLDGSTGLVQLLGDVVASNLKLNDNFTQSSAAANRATNNLSLSADTSLEATGTVANIQGSSAAVTSIALMQGGIVNAGDLPATPGGTFPYGLGAAELRLSSVEVDNNATQAVARGNTATNLLNASSAAGIATGTTFTEASAVIGQAYTTTSGSPVTIDDGGILARADYAMLNAQTNTGPVTARVDGSFGGVLNSGAVDRSSLSVSGNSLAADAIGNYAGNTINVAAGTPNSTPMASIASAQINAGNVTATAVGGSTTFGQFAGSGALVGSLARSSVNVTGNSVSARAVGNSVVNRITSN